MKWLQRLKGGLSKTSGSITKEISKIFVQKKLDEATIEEFEEMLISADIGVETTGKIISSLAKEKFDKQVSADEIKEFLSQKIDEILNPVAKKFEPKQQPHVVLVCGVNGNGKTTTIGKIAAKFAASGKKVMLVACDTFRAAAVEQLEVWAERTSSVFIKGDLNADPASVAYRGVEQALQEGVDLVLIDTAGRLHNKANLMEELSKINNVIKKKIPAAPHDTILTLDATTGQNALQQAASFKDIVDISGLVITKLDGTAKGGITVAIAAKFALPIFYIGVGEGIDDLNNFNSADFAKFLVS